MPTERLCVDDPYITECEVTIVYVQDDLVVTDRTIFFAEGESQGLEPGWIGDIPVIDVQKQLEQSAITQADDINKPQAATETVIIHRLDHHVPFKVGQKVQMQVAWQSRYLCHSILD